LLFHGPQNVGKCKAALALAQHLNCQRLHSLSGLPPEGAEACGTCPPCRKILESVHPDVTVVQADGQFIRIDQIRAITEQLAMNPCEAGQRVVVLDEAERMNLAAANAFLKTLEEPPADTLIVLVSSQPGRLPDTIRSRCMPLAFGLLPPDLVRQVLAQGHGLSAEELAFAVRFSQGRLRPQMRQNAGRFMTLRDNLIHALENLSAMAYEQFAEKAVRWAAHPEDMDFVLECLESWFHDVTLLGMGLDETHWINRDKASSLAAWMPHLPPERAETCFNAVLATRDTLALNANKTLALESLWLTIKQTAV